ncbi:hypothetical protein MBH78_16555 [Oceanimonas sp. NS1]|nr:hypothetical protein [Oceanimonas sp. NS1]
MLAVLASPAALAATGQLDLTGSAWGLLALAIFTVAYLLVTAEEYLHLRKSIPVLVAAGIIWVLIGWIYTCSRAYPASPKQPFATICLNMQNCCCSCWWP